jgi:hypothetical protein
MSSVPSPPRELKQSGRALWAAVTTEYELEEHERGLLLEMARSVDQLDALAAIVPPSHGVGPFVASPWH